MLFYINEGHNTYSVSTSDGMCHEYLTCCNACLCSRCSVSKINYAEHYICLDVEVCMCHILALTAFPPSSPAYMFIGKFSLELL